MIDINTIFRLKTESFVIREVSDEMVLVPLVSDIADMTNILNLNNIGSDIIKALDGKKTLSEICDQLYQEYDVDMDTLRNDVLQFIGDAVKKGVVGEIRN